MIFVNHVIVSVPKHTVCGIDTQFFKSISVIDTFSIILPITKT